MGRGRRPAKEVMLSEKVIRKEVPVKAVTPKDGAHYFFGYFDKFQFDSTDTLLLGNRVDFTGRQPRFGEKNTVGVIDPGKATFEPLAQTLAWNWQQGSMLQWFSDREVIFNDVEDGQYVARILDIHSGRSRTLCRPIYCLSPDRHYALSINFQRLGRERPGYGYEGLEDPGIDFAHPEDDGIFLLDLEKNSARLILSVDQVVKAYPRDGMWNTPSWFNHLLFNPTGTRFAFFHRWRTWKDNVRCHLTHMFTANLDGSDLFPLNLEDMSSHYAWINDREVINFSNRFRRVRGVRTNEPNWQYYRYHDQTDQVEVVAEDYFPGDGHCLASPNQQWMVTDSYPEADPQYARNLFLYHFPSRQGYQVGSFWADPLYPTPTRCDLHSRWSHDGRCLTFDSIHEKDENGRGRRRIYLADVSAIVDP